jgi:hypothetical protein
MNRCSPRFQNASIRDENQPVPSCRHDHPAAYDDFFAAFRFDFATDFFSILDENVPVCGGFDSPSTRPLLFVIVFLLSYHHQNRRWKNLISPKPYPPWHRSFSCPMR